MATDKTVEMLRILSTFILLQLILLVYYWNSKYSIRE